MVSKFKDGWSINELVNKSIISESIISESIIGE